jgi:hypothetical protein
MTRINRTNLALAAAFAASLSSAAALQLAAQQAKAENKLLVVAFCPASQNNCTAYLQSARQAFAATLFRSFAVYVAVDPSSDSYALELARRERVDQATVLVIGPDGKKLWAAIGQATAAEVAASLDRGVCAATVHNAPQIPPVFRQQNGEACKTKAAGVSWSPEPEVLRRPN